MTNAPARGVLATSVLGVAELRRTLSARGWRVAVLTGGTSRAEALDAIGRALRFPDYYGRNLDALWDCLTDLDAPTALVWSGWEAIAVHAADDWARIVRVLDQRVRETGRPPFAVVFVAARHPDQADDSDAEPV